jgi:hypothetical protein
MNHTKPKNMKTNNTISDAQTEFMKSIQLSFAKYYSRTLSDNIKRGIARKKELKQQLSVSEIK